MKTEATTPARSAQETMRAVVQDRYGTAPEAVLRVARVGRPTPRDDEVLVRVGAAGVDRGTWHLMAGLPYLMRVIGFGLHGPKTRVPGLDLAGTVEAVGRDVSGLEPGDEVFGTGTGSFAEFSVAKPGRLAPKPANLTFEQAAAVPGSATTALQAVRDKGQVCPGEHVLVLGASGGVGTYAVQLAKAFGARVTGVCSTGKTDLVRAIGADRVVDYTHEDLMGGPDRYDVIVDIGGNRPVSALRRALTPRGRLVITGGEDGGRWLGGVERNLRAHLLSPFVTQKLGAFVARQRAEDLLVLRDLVESGAVTPVVDRIYPLDQASAALRHLAEGRARGKVVVAVA
ncbi:MAG: NAD(P)-dependent alcohol dehydrogenase [Actinomycetota bacterium]|nr:NAD(P)-dependent alcohol dehydrogenase [Actinomycetota bacterium]